MGLGTILQIIIALIFIYFILSLLTSEIQEAISAFLENRAKLLKKSIQTLLSELSPTNDSKEVWLSKDTTNNETYVIELPSKTGEFLIFLDSSNNPVKNTSNKKVVAWQKEKLKDFDANNKVWVLLDEKDRPIGERAFQKSDFAKEVSSEEVYILLDKNKNPVFDQSFDDHKLQYDSGSVWVWLINNHEVQKVLDPSKLFDNANQPGKKFAWIDQNNNQVDKPSGPQAHQGQEIEAIEVFKKQGKLRKVQIITARKILSRSITDLLYEESQIASLNQSTWNISQVLGRESIGPSYISPQVFSNSLLNVIQDHLPSEQTLKNSDPVDDIIKKIEVMTFYSPGIEKIKQLAERARFKHPTPTLKELDLEIQDWFKQVQERTTGVYTRNSKGLSFVVGFLVAFAGNIDTFFIVNQLQNNPNVTSAFAQEIENAYNTSKQCLEKAAQQTDQQKREQAEQQCYQEFGQEAKNNLQLIGSPLVVGQVTVLENCLSDAKEVKSKQDECLAEFQGKVKNESISFLSLGWNEANLQKTNWFFKIFGLILTAIAITMGAPFWFELLGKVINVRYAGKLGGNSEQQPNPTNSGTNPPSQQG